MENQCLNEILQCSRDIRNGEKTYYDMNNIFIKYGIANFSSIDSLRRVFKIFTMFDESGYVSIPTQHIYKETSGIEKNGNLISDKLIELSDMDKNCPSSILQAHGFNPAEFELVSCRNSIWNTNSKEGTKNLYSSKITVKPTNINLDFNFLDEYFKNKEFSKIRKIPNYKNVSDEGDFLEIDIADYHIGLLSDKNEVGESYDIDIALQYFKDSIDEIIYKSQNKNFSKIILVNLGDFIHINNSEGTTAKGTKQDACARITSIFTKALDLLIDTIDRLANIAPVEVVSVSGNHDREISTYLFIPLEKIYRNDTRVKFNVGPNPFKAQRYGQVLIGWTHGNLKKENITDWLQVYYSKDYGDSKWREIHSGHFHSQGIIDKAGIIVRYLPKLCAPSFWEYSNGYSSAVKSVTAFVWNPNKGLKETWFINVGENN